MQAPQKTDSGSQKDAQDVQLMHTEKHQEAPKRCLFTSASKTVWCDYSLASAAAADLSPKVELFW